MPIEPRPLPCPPDALSPQLSPEQIALHRLRQQADLDAVNAAIAADPAFAEADLDAIARRARGALAAHAAQAWADDVYWGGLRAAPPDNGNEPAGPLADAIGRGFGDAARLRERFTEAALRLSGSGWVWLAQRRDGRLAVLATPVSVAPLAGGDTALLACCLWPHAYAHDYGTARDRYLASFWQIVNWKAVARRMR